MKKLSTQHPSLFCPEGTKETLLSPGQGPAVAPPWSVDLVETRTGTTYLPLPSLFLPLRFFGGANNVQGIIWREDDDNDEDRKDELAWRKKTKRTTTTTRTWGGIGFKSRIWRTLNQELQPPKVLSEEYVTHPFAQLWQQLATNEKVFGPLSLSPHFSHTHKANSATKGKKKKKRAQESQDQKCSLSRAPGREKAKCPERVDGTKMYEQRYGTRGNEQNRWILPSKQFVRTHLTLVAWIQKLVLGQFFLLHLL